MAEQGRPTVEIGIVRVRAPAGGAATARSIAAAVGERVAAESRGRPLRLGRVNVRATAAPGAAPAEAAAAAVARALGRARDA